MRLIKEKLRESQSVQTRNVLTQTTQEIIIALTQGNIQYPPQCVFN